MVHKAETPTLEDAEAVGVAGVEGAEGSEAPLWEAEDEERVGEAFREPGLERRPRERNAARPCDAPSGRMNFSLSSRLVRPRAADRENRDVGRFLFRLLSSAPPAGGGRGSEQREGESRCFLGCRHHSRCMFGERSRCLERWQLRKSAGQKFGWVVCEEEEESGGVQVQRKKEH